MGISVDSRVRKQEDPERKVRTHDYILKLIDNKEKPLERRRPRVFIDESYIDEDHRRKHSRIKDEHDRKIMKRNRRLCFAHGAEEMPDDEVHLLDDTLWVFEALSAKKASKKEDQ